MLEWREVSVGTTVADFYTIFPFWQFPFSCDESLALNHAGLAWFLSRLFFLPGVIQSVRLDGWQLLIQNTRFLLQCPNIDVARSVF